MPTDTVQENWGTTTVPAGSTSLNVPLTGGNNPGGVGTTGGNTVAIFVTGVGAGMAPPTDWFEARQVIGSLAAFFRPDIPAGETSWTLTFTTLVNARDVSWWVVELSGVDPVMPLEVAASNGPTGVVDGGTLSSGTTPLSSALNTIALAAFAADGTVGSTWSGYTNGFEEVREVTPTNDYRLAVARKTTVGATGTYSTTATLDTTGASSTSTALVVVFRATGSPIVQPLHMIAGFEPGHHGGIASHNGITSLLGALLSTPAGTWGTNYLIQAASARNSGFGLRVVAAGNAVSVPIGQLPQGSGGSFGFDTRVVSGSGTVVVANYGSRWQLLYDTATNKFGVRAGTTGTISWQSGTTPLNTFVWVDIRVKHNTTTWRVEWTLETGTDTYTEQPAAELTGQTAGDISNQALNLGLGSAQTMTADFDNVVMSSYWTAYPLTPHQVRALVPDTAATVGYSGTPGNFAIVANNATSTALAGTGGNITTTGVAARLDDIPPDVSASTDGVVQTTAAASDYLQFPMQDPTVSADEIVAGVRVLAALISTTGAGAGDLALRGWDGAAETALASVSQVTPSNPTAPSSTAPRWLCAMWQQASGWTVAKLLAAAVRMGFAGDATPDMGCRSILIEYAVRKARAGVAVGQTGDVALTANINPNTEGIRSIVVDTPVGKGATLNWSVGGTPDSQAVAPASSYTEVLDAPDLSTVDYVEIVSDNEASDRP